MDVIFERIKNIIETHPDYVEGDFEIKDNKKFKTLYFCDIAIIRVTPMKTEIRLEVAKNYFERFSLISYNTNSDSAWIRISFDNQSIDTICLNAKEVFKKCYKDSAEFTFGCCSRFFECSNAKKCICNEVLYFNGVKRFPSGCTYKDNLDQGHIFYGENKNYPTVKNDSGR